MPNDKRVPANRENIIEVAHDTFNAATNDHEYSAGIDVGPWTVSLQYCKRHGIVEGIIFFGGNEYGTFDARTAGDAANYFLAVFYLNEAMCDRAATIAALRYAANAQDN